MFSKVNILSKTLIIAGLLISASQRIIGIDLLEIIGFTLMATGLVLGKNDFIKSNEEYGKHIYYILMTLLLLLIFFYWFI